MGASSITVTFLFTDIEGSTRLWQVDEMAMRDAVSRHDAVVRSIVENSGGSVFSTMGDGFAAAFRSADAALHAAQEAQRALTEMVWPTTEPIRVRMGVHSGEAEEREGNYFGTAVNRAARLMSIAHGGQVICSSTTAELAEGAATGLVDLGEHRLRDLDRSVRVFQVGRGSFPSLRSLDARPGNLPTQGNQFVGRDKEVVLISEALQESRIVTLTGVGGVGKTRLAVQVGAELAPHYLGGVWLVELAGLIEADGVAEAMIAALRIAPQPGMTLTEALAAALSTKPTLVVLDNCEHLVEAAASFADEAIRAARELTLLVTSREALGLTDERIITVSPLPVPKDDVSTEESLATDAVRLFIDRARAVRAGFALGPDNTDSVVRICRRLDGIPLAVELAAARVRSMSPSEIASRLDSRFQLLTGGRRGATSRHQTLRRAIDWSFELLSPGEAEVLQRLSVCAGGFNLTAAEAIGCSETLDRFLIVDLIDHLVDKSLVVAEDLGAETRYRMLETIRDYAFEKLEASGHAAEARLRHIAYYTERAQEIGEGMRGPQEFEWLEEAERELDNLRAAVVSSCMSEDCSDAQRILAALGQHGTRLEASVSTWAAGVVTAVRSALNAGAPTHPLWPATLSLAAWRHLRDGDRKASESMGAEALRVSDTGSDLEKWSRCMVYATTTALDIYSARVDVAACEEWSRLAKEIGDLYVESLGSTMLCVHLMFSDKPGAVESGESGVAAARACGSPTAMAYALMTLGQALGDHDPRRSVLLLDEAIAMAESVANEWAVGVCSASRGAVLSKWGDRPAAARALLESAERSSAGGNRLSVGQGLWGVAAQLAMQDRLEGAARILGWVRAMTGGVDMVYGLREEFSAAVAALPGRLGPDRYEELALEGARMSDHVLMALATTEVDALFVSSE